MIFFMSAAAAAAAAQQPRRKGAKARHVATTLLLLLQLWPRALSADGEHRAPPLSTAAALTIHAFSHATRQMDVQLVLV
jgi:hypothetical protein